MCDGRVSRRRFLGDVAVLGGATVLGAGAAGGMERRKRGKLHVACNQYPWLVFYGRDGKDFNASLDSGLG
ncbi:MAG: hypothetical protein JSU94_05470, partial [Phycisphaerales bacterium]